MCVARHPPSLFQPLDQVLSPIRAGADLLFDTTNIRDIPIHFWYLIGLFVAACNSTVFALSKPNVEAMRDFIGLQRDVMRLAMVL
jgi:hypothetical protein